MNQGSGHVGHKVLVLDEYSYDSFSQKQATSLDCCMYLEQAGGRVGFALLPQQRINGFLVGFSMEKACFFEPGGIG
jgi:hypothetical protein